ncbi:MAG TPA: hypothetical protein IGR64_06090, partial [Leptolyngbyaceae cyanobacterium M65_K2018_010]|nr:hypothetical protein [Leptolyngbyaceae cyanobacterium M65_K2018_010]
MRNGLLQSQPRWGFIQISRFLRPWWVLPLSGLVAVAVVALALALAHHQTLLGLTWQGWLTIALTLGAFGL